MHGECIDKPVKCFSLFVVLFLFKVENKSGTETTQTEDADEVIESLENDVVASLSIGHKSFNCEVNIQPRKIVTFGYVRFYCTLKYQNKNLNQTFFFPGKFKLNLGSYVCKATRPCSSGN